MNTAKIVKSAFESMMFVWGEPLDVKTAAQICDISTKEAYEYFKELQNEYEAQGRGIVIREINRKFQFCTRFENNEFVERLCVPLKGKKLSQSALEVLAIIAYKQPVTRVDIESIRGVKCDRAIEGLTRKNLIEEKDRAETIGRPILYGTTQTFLEKFGITNIKQLPEIEDIENAIKEGEVDLDVEDDEEDGYKQISISI